MGSSHDHLKNPSLCEDPAMIEQRARGDRATHLIRQRRDSRERLRREAPPDPERPEKK